MRPKLYLKRPVILNASFAEIDAKEAKGISCEIKY
jgi:hypothetical protein